MFEQKVSYRYAKALLDLATQRGEAEKFYNEIQSVALTLNMSRELRSLIVSPVFQISKKKSVFREIFKEEHISSDLLDFLFLLIDKRRGDLIASIANQYKIQYNELNNRLMVDVVSAVPLDDRQKKEITERMTQWTKKTILPEFKLDPKLKGGIFLKLDDWVYDFSVKKQLENIHDMLATGSKFE